MTAGLALLAALAAYPPNAPAEGRHAPVADAALAQALPAAPAAPPAAAPDVVFEVPFLPQGPLLCGGAAAAMLERYWGARGVYAEDYGALVREEEGGIRTDDLVRELRARGWVATVLPAATAREAVEEAALEAPLVLLLSSGRTRFHYVVLVGVDGKDALLHDPMLGPARSLGLDELHRRWSRSRYWTLRVTPAVSKGEGAPTGAAGPGDPRAKATAERTHERADTAPPPDGGTVHPLAARAMEALREGRYEEASGYASELRERAPRHARLAERLLATASFLAGEPERALTHWNGLGEPRLDLIEIRGLDRTRHPLVWRYLGVRPGAMLTAAALARARRRIARLPAVSSSRVGYRPLENGSVVLEVAVVERGPPGRYDLLVGGVEAAVDEEARLVLGPLLGSGDAWRLEGSWREADASFGGSLALLAPPLPGVTRVSAGWRRQRFGTDAGGIDTEEHVRVGVGLVQCWSGRWCGGAELGMHRWVGGSRYGYVGASALRGSAPAGPADPGGWLRGRARAWLGPRPFARFEIEGAAETSRTRPSSWHLRLHAALVTERAPRAVWAGAGTGGLGEPLLRGHPLASGVAIDGAAFGRGLIVASVQHVSWRTVPPGRLGVGGFVDAAWSSGRSAGASAGLFADPGLEVVLEVGPSRGALSLAVGEGGPVLSARVERSWSAGPPS